MRTRNLIRLRTLWVLPSAFSLQPSALFAQGTAATVAAEGLTAASLQANAVTTDKIADGTVAAADVNVDSFNATFWRATGNSGTTPVTHFPGARDNQAIEFMVNGRRALRLEPVTKGGPNVIGGSAANRVAPGVRGATIAGGGALNHSGLPYTNQDTGAFVWPDSADKDFASTAVNQFLIRASGGVGIGAHNPQDALEVRGSNGAFVRMDGGLNNNTGIRWCETNALHLSSKVRNKPEI